MSFLTIKQVLRYFDGMNLLTTWSVKIGVYPGHGGTARPKESGRIHDIENRIHYIENRMECCDWLKSKKVRRKVEDCFFQKPEIPCNSKTRFIA